MTSSRRKILISSGEISGEAYAVEVARSLRRLRPEWELTGIGGPRLAREVKEVWAGLDELSVMGFAEVLRHLPRLARLRAKLARRILEEGVDLLLAVDYPGFHLGMAGRVRRGGVRVLHYIPPKTWSWGAWRNRALRRNVDRCAVIFPFEEKYYRERGIEARFVGHPLLDRHRAALSAPAPPREGLLLAPGSRPQEVKRIAPVLKRAAVELMESGTVERVRISRAPSIDPDLLWSSFASVPAVEVVEGPLFDHLRRARAAVVCSGTASVETALSRTPHVIVYRTSWPTYLTARALATVDSIGMANIVLGRRAFPEFVQGGLRHPALVESLRPLLDEGSGERRSQEAAFGELAQRLGSGREAAENVAAMAVEMLDERR